MQSKSRIDLKEIDLLTIQRVLPAKAQIVYQLRFVTIVTTATIEQKINCKHQASIGKQS